jgi:hypothetical protein
MMLTQTISLQTTSRLGAALLGAAGLLIAGALGAATPPAGADAPSPVIRDANPLLLRQDLTVEVTGRHRLGLTPPNYDGGVYTVAIQNHGGVAVSGAPLDVDIRIDAPLALDHLVLASHGLACQVQGPVVQCRGGRLPAGEQALVQLELDGRAVGTGMVTATLDPLNQVSESNATNDAERNNVGARSVEIIALTDSATGAIAKPLPANTHLFRECLVCRVGTQP